MMPSSSSAAGCSLLPARINQHSCSACCHAPALYAAEAFCNAVSASVESIATGPSLFNASTHLDVFRWQSVVVALVHLEVGGLEMTGEACGIEQRGAGTVGDELRADRLESLRVLTEL